MQTSLVRRADGSYLYVEITDKRCDVWPLDSEEAYGWDCGTGLVHALNSAFTSWVLVIGSTDDAVLYGRNAQGWALAYGTLGSIHVWLPNLTAPRSHIRIIWHYWPVSFGLLREDPSFEASLRYLQDNGELPTISVNTALSPAVVDNVRYRFYRSW